MCIRLHSSLHIEHQIGFGSRGIYACLQSASMPLSSV